MDKYAIMKVPIVFFCLPKLCRGRMKKLSDRPMRSLMVAWEIAQIGSPYMMAIKISDNSF